jgi:hypothetical protein
VATEPLLNGALGPRSSLGRTVEASSFPQAWVVEGSVISRRNVGDWGVATQSVRAEVVARQNCAGFVVSPGLGGGAQDS